MSDLADRLVRAAATAIGAAYLPDLCVTPSEVADDARAAVSAVLRLLADDIGAAITVHRDTIVDRLRAMAGEIEQRAGDA